MFRTFFLDFSALILAAVLIGNTQGQTQTYLPSGQPSASQWQSTPPVLPAQVPVPQPPPPPPPNSQPLFLEPQTGPVPPPPAPAFPLPDPNATLIVPDPTMARIPGPPGFIGALEIGLVSPDISGSLVGPVSGGVNKTIGLPFADLDWTGSPRLFLGYRFAHEAGAFLASYQSVVSEGTLAISPWDSQGAGFLETRLNFNKIDLDYVSPDMALAPLWDFRWDAGVRIAAIYYDSQITGGQLSQSASNNFVGAGPHIGFHVSRTLHRTRGLSLFGKVDGAVVFGGDTQSFEEIGRLPGGGSIGGASRATETQSVPVFGLLLGLTYQPPQNRDWFRFSFGYQYEQWWGVGGAGASEGDLSVQGLFFRGEFQF